MVDAACHDTAQEVQRKGEMHELKKIRVYLIQKKRVTGSTSSFIQIKHKPVEVQRSVTLLILTNLCE